MYQWTDVVFSKQSVLDAVVFSAQKDMQPPTAGLSVRRKTSCAIWSLPFAIIPKRRLKSICRRIRGILVYDDPRRTFRAAVPRPRRVCELLLQYPNVEIYDFSSRIEWITDLDSYFDYSHHSSDMSDEIMARYGGG